MRRIAFALLAGILFAVVAAACTDEEGTEGQDVDTATTEEPTDTPTPEEPSDTAATTAAPVTYEIADREDVSFGAVVRIVYRVGVSGPLTEEVLARIAQEIVDEETGQQDVNAIGFFFYLPDTDTASVYTAGKADWAPDGDWESADTVEVGDYSRHELGAIDIVSP